MSQWSLRMRILTFCVAVVLAIAYFLLTPVSVDNNAVISSGDDAIARGAYLVNAGGCVSCHLAVEGDGSTNPAILSGGHALVPILVLSMRPTLRRMSIRALVIGALRIFYARLNMGARPKAVSIFLRFPIVLMLA